MTAAETEDWTRVTAKKKLPPPPPPLNKQRKTRSVFVYASVDVVNLCKKCMSHTIRFIQRTNEKIVFIIKTTALAYTLLCDRQDVEMLLFYFPLLPSLFGILFVIFFVVFVSSSSFLRQQIRMSIFDGGTRIWAWFHLFLPPPSLFLLL